MNSYKSWHIPFSNDQVTLREAHQSLKLAGAGQYDIPLLIQLVENPRYQIPGFNVFHGAVDLDQHDYIHIILGRGMLPKDEAFVIGFTMGSTKRVSTMEEELFSLISRNFYPDSYKFSEEDIRVFKDAVRLGYISDCRALDEVDFAPLLDESLGEVRNSLGVEKGLINTYFVIEKSRYPDAPESQRLLD